MRGNIFKLIGHRVFLAKGIEQKRLPRSPDLSEPPPIKLGGLVPTLLTNVLNALAVFVNKVELPFSKS